MTLNAYGLSGNNKNVPGKKLRHTVNKHVKYPQIKTLATWDTHQVGGYERER